MVLTFKRTFYLVIGRPDSARQWARKHHIPQDEWVHIQKSDELHGVIGPKKDPNSPYKLVCVHGFDVKLLEEAKSKGL